MDFDEALDKILEVPPLAEPVPLTLECTLCSVWAMQHALSACFDRTGHIASP